MEDGLKWDESDFVLQHPSGDLGREPRFKVNGKRVLDDPVRHRTIYLEPKKTMRAAICYHGRLLLHPCGLCGWEAPRLERDDH